jgi:hypothetical protein
MDVIHFAKDAADPLKGFGAAAHLSSPWLTAKATSISAAFTSAKSTPPPSLKPPRNW